MAAIELQNPARDVIKEVAVMGDGHHGAAIVMQEPLQPGDTFRVQMVGRLVEQQHIGLREQQTAKGDAPPLPA